MSSTSRFKSTFGFGKRPKSTISTSPAPSMQSSPQLTGAPQPTFSGQTGRPSPLHQPNSSTSSISTMNQPGQPRPPSYPGHPSGAPQGRTTSPPMGPPGNARTPPTQYPGGPPPINTAGGGYPGQPQQYMGGPPPMGGAPHGGPPQYQGAPYPGPPQQNIGAPQPYAARNNAVEVEGAGRSKSQLIVGIDFVSGPLSFFTKSHLANTNLRAQLSPA